jgi:hypothetical protein
MSNTKYRIKKLSEFKKDYTVDDYGDYLVDGTWFNSSKMRHLCGVELTDVEARLILSSEKNRVLLTLGNGPAGKHNEWHFSRGMITEIKTTKKSYLKDMKAKTTQTISRQGLESIYYVACSSWKDKIAVDIAADKPFAQEYEISNEYISQMFKASSTEQKAVLIAAGLKNPTEKVSQYAKITSYGAGRENILLPIQLDMDDKSPLEILIGAGLVSDKYKHRCLIPVSNVCNVVPEVLFNVEGRDWMIVFKKKP